MANFPFVVGDSLQIGTAQITATGNAIVLPSGTQVGSTPVATTQEVATGGGPKISNLQITDNSWAVLDDTAVDTAGGYILITGTNFVSGALVYFNQTPATSVAFVSATTLRVTVPALTAGTYIVYVINPDGGTAIRVPGLTASANPAWQTASALPEQYDGIAITLNLVATDATTYTLTSGSLPPGLSLNSNTGVITGTVTGVTVDTTYTFTVQATDAQLQDSPRTFTVTVAVSDAYFKFTTLLLSGSALSANTVVRDSSTNNFNLTVYGDARASNFTPYGGGWSLLTRDRSYITIPASSDFDIINTDFTIEFWFNPNAFNTMSYSGSNFFGTGLATAVNGWSMGWSGSGTTVTAMEFRVFASQAQSANSFTGLTVNFGTWYHIALQRNGASAGNLRLFVNGVLQGSAQTANTYSIAGGNFVLGSGSYLENGTYSGNADYYISNIRLTKSAVYDITGFTPPTSNLTQLTNTTLLIGQSNRLINNGTNTGAITSSGHTSTRVQLNSFNPFNITNTGVNGSMYFDGTTDSVRLPSNTISALPGDFTLEFWIYLISTAGNPVIYLVNATAALIIYVVSSKVVVRSYGTADLLTSVDNIQINTWTHVAVARSGSALSLWLNGSRASGGTITYSTAFPQGEIRIATNENDAQSTNGYIADLRLIKGTAQYNPSNTTITVPTAPLTAIADTQLLTCQFDQPHNNHTFLDSSSNQFLITRSGNATQGTFSPFSPGGWSNYFNNASSIVCASNAAFAVGTGNFTVECFVNFSSTTVRNRFFCVGTSGTDGILLELNSGVLQVGIQNTYPINYTWAPIIGTWYHVAIVRTGTGANQVVLYIDGASVATGTSSASVSQNPVNIGGISWNSTWALLGYLSNVRFSNSARTITVPTSPYVSDANTLVLTCQSNRFLDQTGKTITVNSTPSVQAFSPFAATAVYNPVVHGGSAYFDGTGDYLSIPNNSAFDFGSGDFSIEAWVYVPNVSGSKAIITKDDAARSWIFDLNNADAFFAIPGSTTSTLTNAVQANTWVHLYFGRSGNTMYKAVNGSVSSDAWTTTIPTTSTAVEIGRQGGYGNPFNGYISGLRVLKGSAAYTSNFTPSAPPTAISNTVLLTNFADAAILDSTGRTVIETVADARTSSVVTKFTGGSMYFDGTGDGLAWPISSTPFYQIVSTNWTIEMWMYKFSTAIKNIMRCGPANAGNINRGWSIGIDPSINTIYFSSSGADNTFTGATIAINTWVHLAFSYTVSDSTLRVFYNGTSAGTKANPALVNPTIAGGDFLTVATPYSGTAHFDGYLSDIRFTQGYARYTANFTAPTAPARLK